MRIHPFWRPKIFDRRFQQLLRKVVPGSRIIGDGTLFSAEGEPLSCDLEVSIPGTPERALALAVAFAEYLGAPKGSTATHHESETTEELGKNEGVALYLPVGDLLASVRDEHPVELFLERVNARGMRGVAEWFTWWEDERQASAYFYGRSAERIRESLGAAIAGERLAEGSRIVDLRPDAA